MKIRMSLLCLSFIFTNLISNQCVMAEGDDIFSDSTLGSSKTSTSLGKQKCLSGASDLHKNDQNKSESNDEYQLSNNNERENINPLSVVPGNGETLLDMVSNDVLLGHILPLLSYQDAARFGLTCYHAQTLFKGSCHYTALLQQILMRTYSFRFYDYFRILRANPKQVRAITPALQSVLKLKADDGLGSVLNFEKIFDDPRRLTECMQSLLESMSAVLTQFCAPAKGALKIEMENEVGEFDALAEIEPAQIKMLNKLEWLVAGAVCILRYGRLDNIGLSRCSDQKQKERMTTLVAKLKESKFFQDFLKLISEKKSFFENFHLDVYPDYHCCSDEDKEEIYLFFVMRFFAMIVSRAAELPPEERVNVFQTTETYSHAWKLESFFAECNDPLLLEMLVELLLMPKITVIDANYTMEVRCRELQPYLYAYRGLLANRHLPSEYKETVMSLFLGHVLRSGITSRPMRDAVINLGIPAEQLFDILENNDDLSLSYRILLCRNLCRRSDVDEIKLRENMYKTLITAIEAVDNFHAGLLAGFPPGGLGGHLQGSAAQEDFHACMKLLNRYAQRPETPAEQLAFFANEFIESGPKGHSSFALISAALSLGCSEEDRVVLEKKMQGNILLPLIPLLERAQNFRECQGFISGILRYFYPDQNSMELLMKGLAENPDASFTIFPGLDETDATRRVLAKAESLSVKNWHIFTEALICYASSVQSNRQYDFEVLENYLPIYIKKLQSIWAGGAAAEDEKSYFKNSFQRLVEALLQAPHGLCKLLPLLIEAGSYDGIRCAISCMQIQQPAKSCLYQHAVEMALELVKESEGLENNTAMALQIYKSCMKQPDFPLEKYAYEIFEDLFIFNPEQRANLLTYGLLHANDDYRHAYRYAALMVDVALEMLRALEAVNMNDEVKLLVSSLLVSRHIDDAQRIDLALKYPEQCLEDDTQREHIFRMYLESAKIWKMPEAVNLLEVLFQCGLRLNIDLETFIVSLLEKIYAVPSGFNRMLDFLEAHVDDEKLISIYSGFIRKNTLSKKRLQQVIMNSENKSHLFQRNVSKAICQGTFSKLIKEATSEAG